MPTEWDNVYSEAEVRRLFKGLVQRPFGCIEWRGARNRWGYGLIKAGGMCRYAHRMMMEVRLKRRLSATEVVMHKVCDNPRCCNPDHLEVGDVAANVRDAIEKGRHNPPRKKKARRLTAEEVTEVRLFLMCDHSIYSLALRYGCGESTIRDIRDNRSWRGLPWPRRKDRRPSDPFA